MGRRLGLVLLAAALAAGCGSGVAGVRSGPVFSPSRLHVAGFDVRLTPLAHRWRLDLTYRGPARTVSWTATWLTVAATSASGAPWAGRPGAVPSFVILKPLRPGQHFTETYPYPPPGRWTLTVRVLGHASGPIRWQVPPQHP